MVDVRRLVVRFLVGMLLVVVVAEVGARVAEATGPPALRWYDATTQLKIDQMDKLDRAEVVFAGTSMVWQGFVPSEFATIDGRSAYNAGLAGGVPEVMERWLTEEVVPRLEPNTVVWGLSSLDFSASYGADNRDRYDDALETRAGPLATTERATADLSALVRYRSVLRDPAALFGDGGEASSFEEAERIIGENGERRDFVVDPSARRGEIIGSRLAGFDLDVIDIAAIHRTVTELRSQGIEVVLAQMPTPNRYAGLHPGGFADIARAAAAIEATAAALDLPVIDLTGGYVDDDFVDFTHLDEASAADLTARLADALPGGPAKTTDPGGDAATRAPPIESLARTATRAIDVNDLIFARLTGSPAASASELWFGAAHYGHTRDLAVMEVAEDRPEVVFIGSSMMLNAADPAAFTAADGRSSYNASIAAAGPEVLNDWVSGRFFDLAHPEVVIVGVAPRHVRHRDVGQGCAEDISRWLEASAIRSGVFAPIAPLADFSTDELLFGMPASAEPSLTTPIHDNYRSTFDSGGGRSRYGRLSEEEKADRLGRSAEWQREFAVCDARMDAVGQTVQSLAAQGVDVVVVAMPIPDFRAELFAEGRRTVDTVVAAFAARVEAAGAAGFVDLSDLIADGNFRDITHVDLEGSIQFTERLAQEIGALGI